MVKNLLNKLGYYKLTQLRVGGMCGCCGKSIPRWIWVDCGNNWDDIGLCDYCQSGNVDIDASILDYIATKSKSR